MNFQVPLEVVGGFAADGVDLVQQAHGHSQAGAGFRAFDELLSDLDRVKDDALAGADDVREDLMFGRIVLRAVGRIVGDARFEIQAVRRALHVFLEQVVRALLLPPPLHRISNLVPAGCAARPCCSHHRAKLSRQSCPVRGWC